MNDLPVRIRPAEMDDLDAVVSVHTAARTAAYREGGVPEGELDGTEGIVSRFNGWARAIQLPGKTTLCAEVDGEVVGVLSMESDAPGTALELSQIHVRPGQWRRGVGGRLHAAYVQALRETGVLTGLVGVWERNDRARAFYTRLGWRPDGTVGTTSEGLRCLRLRLDVASA
ncbi:GNAT family N-acetyltransferase [Streptomyces sp. H10-C2]|uniref:GNAT family N-acetyltransferase n=1 Tax=unclassified Streptomyces TaxID=2593676 RepID=UPI0024BAC6AD|nr:MULTISPECIES: GNAT family N-acetyltransferase [unclassified Streptomyces]MDJ0344329.1 GNAT family N-acetyltransferase [Streptomyces sp. PH10-H1]MDJ0373698.1 GNAT family N-acetyltransferase [Streptomyces sp. H10-C2]